MAQYPFNKLQLSRGFTVIEVLVASTVFGIGLLAAAAFIGGAIGSTARSEYMTQAATLATEKLEDLNHYPAAFSATGQDVSEQTIAVTSGSSAGSLTSDLVQNVTTNGITTSVNYYDDVYFSPGVGALQETTSSLDVNGNLVYTTIAHQPNGAIGPPTTSTTAPTGAGLIGFERRWLIEANTPITGVRRVTVLVTLLNQSVHPPVKFQMSMVRP
jgi:type IV pilus modification protein PilV